MDAMDIVFGLWADGGAVPDHGGDGSASVGAPVVGPNGLLDILETILGLSAPPSAYVVRIAAWQAALEAVDDGNRFWSKSLQVDPWATARTVLTWRDQLVEAGWNSAMPIAGKRISDIGAAVAASENLPSGAADRLARLNRMLVPKVAQVVRRIRLVDRCADLPVGWRTLMKRLARNGVSVEEIAAKPSAPPDTALGKLQNWIASGGALEGRPDGSVVTATAASLPLAAEIAGQWFSSLPKSRSLALILQASDSQLLDHGLNGSGQPRAGRSRRSPFRGSLQLLLLAFKVAWEPFDAHALMELLLFPRSPVAGRAASRLADALQEAPGRGGELWQAAWADIGAHELDTAKDDKDRAKARTRLARWRAWTEGLGADPLAGMPAAEMVAVCDRVISWAAARHALDDDPLYLSTATLASDVRRALVALERKNYPRSLIERIIDQALDEGQDNPNAFAEASAWRSITHAGAVWSAVDTLVWWNFLNAGENVQSAPWTAAERVELEAQDCALDETAQAGRALSAAWERAVLNTTRCVLLVSAGLDAHSEDKRHPFAHRIAPALDILADKVRLEDALAASTLTVAGETLPRTAIQTRALPDLHPVWPTPEGFQPRLDAGAESATSFENLLTCQLRWALRHVAHIRPGRARSIPDGNRLLGNLAHALAREIFQPGAPPEPRAAADRTAALLDGFIDRMAAPLRGPSEASDLAFARRRLPEAMAELSRMLTQNGLTVVATEQQVSGVFEDILPVNGALDLVARDGAGAPVIVDLKWTRSAKKRFEELRGGKAVQLATYGALLAGDGPYRAGYFLLNQRQFATLTQGGLIGRPIEGARSLPETWDAILASWRLWRERAQQGTLLAVGVEGAEDHMPAELPLALEVHCDRCDYATLCRMRGLQ